MSPTVYLVSGANRGIGLGLVTQLAARENVVVFAGARNPSGAKELHALEAKYPGKVHAVQLTSSNKADNEAAITQIKHVAGRLDVVIANAGLGETWTPALETPAEAMIKHYDVNVVGPLVLFQAAYSLLTSSTETPKFAIISTFVGSVSAGPGIPSPTLAYGASKAAVNWLASKLFYEHPTLISVPISPGAVATDMNASARAADPVTMGNFPAITVETSAAGCLKVIDEAKRGEDGPKFVNYDGVVLPW